MTQDYTSLALGDLVHLMSPSPAPQNADDHELPPRTNSASPEPIQDADIQQIRNRVIELGELRTGNVRLTPREKELADMVLRLTAAVRPDSEQLVRQAGIISALTEQRDLLVRQAEEQQLRWNAEKDGWARMAEALIVQQTKSRSHSSDDYERLPTIEADNKTLRQRLTETQTRLQILESEITRLRPLLLMQPLIPTTSIVPPTPRSKSHHRKRKKDGHLTAEDDEHLVSEEESPPPGNQDTPTPASHSQATPRTKSRKSEAAYLFNTTAHKRRPSQKTVSRGLSADARAEHLLLAARKLGKQRAGIMSGMVQQFEERERERRREESAVTVVANTPKTPKRVATNPAYPQEAGYVYVNSQMRPGPGTHPVPLFVPAYPHNLFQTPSSSTTVPSAASSSQPSTQKQKSSARTTNPPTPLDSLLSAARTMMREDVEVDEDEDVDVVGDDVPERGTRRTRPRDTFGSPVPKRRKVSGDKLTVLQLPSASTDLPFGTSKQTVGNTTVGRVRSALDVLADQAAAFSSQEQAVALSQALPPVQRKGKGKEKERVDGSETIVVTSKLRERQKSGRKRSVVEEADTLASSARPTSPSRSPRSDIRETMLATSSRRERSTSEALNDPGGSGGPHSSSPGSHQQSTPDMDETVTPMLPRPSTLSTQVDELGDATPRARIPQGTLGTSTGVLQPDFVAQLQATRQRVSTVPIAESSDLTKPPSLQRAETAPVGTGPAKNKDLVRVAGQDVSGSGIMPPGKRQRSPYVKWSKEEDDLLAQAVAKYGQKWDLVQKALPSRGYHQVRQRWLRKLGVFDSKPDLSSYQTAANTFGHGEGTGVGPGLEPRGNPKLGLAPLSSERAFSAVLRGERGGGS